MNKTIYSRYDKHAINSLPTVNFEGRVISIITEAEAEKAVDYLLSTDILGFDTETRPAFKRGQSFRVALLQVSTRDTCFLFRLNLIGLCPAVIRLLEDNTVKKIGLSWHDDLRMLHRRGDFTPGEFIDLQNIVGEIGVKDLSLQKLYANLFSQKISKRQRLTNWEVPILNDAQKVYAATDAWACVMLYEEICRLKETQEYDLIVVPEPEPPAPQPSGEKEKKKKKRPARKRKRPIKTEREVTPEGEKSTAEKKPKHRTTKKKNDDIQENIS